MTNLLNKVVKVTLVGDAFLDDDGSFSAHAVFSKNDIENTEGDSENGYPVNYALVKWNTLENWDGEDGGEACNWDMPEGIRLSNQWVSDGLIGVNDFNGYSFEFINE